MCSHSITLLPRHVICFFACTLQAIASCHSLVLQLARCLLQLLQSLSQQLQQQQLKTASRGSGGSSSSALNTAGHDAATEAAAGLAADSRQQQYASAVQLLQQLFLHAPASFVALDCLPQLCKALMGPSGAHALLHGPYAASSSSSSHKQQQQQAAAEVAECLPVVVGAARRLAAAVSPRCVVASMWFEQRRQY